MKAKIERRKLAALYAQIPTFECVPGCHDCCGPVTATREELKAAPKLMSLEQLSEHLTLESCLDCPYVTPSGCGIYDDRPFLCRIFGTVPEMKCPHGRGPDRMLSTDKGYELRAKYRSLFE